MQCVIIAVVVIVCVAMWPAPLFEGYTSTSLYYTAMYCGVQCNSLRVNSREIAYTAMYTRNCTDRRDFCCSQ